MSYNATAPATASLGSFCILGGTTAPKAALANLANTTAPDTVFVDIESNQNIGMLDTTCNLPTTWEQIPSLTWGWQGSSMPTSIPLKASVPVNNCWMYRYWKNINTSNQGFVNLGDYVQFVLNPVAPPEDPALPLPSIGLLPKYMTIAIPTTNLSAMNSFTYLQNYGTGSNTPYASFSLGKDNCFFRVFNVGAYAANPPSSISLPPFAASLTTADTVVDCKLALRTTGGATVFKCAATTLPLAKLVTATTTTNFLNLAASQNIDPLLYFHCNKFTKGFMSTYFPNISSDAQALTACFPAALQYVYQPLLTASSPVDMHFDQDFYTTQANATTPSFPRSTCSSGLKIIYSE